LPILPSRPRAQLDGLRIHMEEALSEDAVDPAAVRATAEKIADLKRKLVMQPIERIPMSLESANIKKLITEIDTLRRQVTELEGAEQRCRKAETALEAFEKRNRLLGDSTPLGIFTIDNRGGITGFNRKMQVMFSCLTDETKSKNLFDCQALEASGVFADIKRCIAQKKPAFAEHPYTDPRGTCTHLRYHLSPIPGADGKVNGVMGFVEDYTDQKKADEALKVSEKRYRQLFQSSPIALIEWDAFHLKAYLEELRVSGVSDFRAYLERNPGQVRHCWSLIKTVSHNQAFLELMGVHDGVDHDGAFVPTDSEFFLKMAREIAIVAAEGNPTNEKEVTIVTTTGEPKVVLGKSMAVSGHEEDLTRVTIALVDISQRKRAEAALRDRERRFRDQAFRDGLTGLYNQRYLYRSLAELVEGSKTADTPISVIFMDLDHFKGIVDAYGHLNGSRAIRKVACTIDNCLKEPAYAVAYAGDEFVVVLPGMDQRHALQKASEIRSRMKSTVYVLDRGIEIRLQASFGVANFPQHASDSNSLIDAADHALFAVKRAGKDAIGRFQ